MENNRFNQQPSAPLSHQEIAAPINEQLIDPNLAHQASVGGLKRFVGRFRRPADTADTPNFEAESATDLPSAEVMSESTTNIFAEQPRVPESQEFQFLSNVLSADSLTKRKADIASVIESSPSLKAYGEIYESKIQNSKRWATAHNVEDAVTMQQLDREAATLREAEQAYDSPTKLQYASLREQVVQIDRNNVISIDSSDPVAAELLGLINQTQAEPKSDAPFKHYAQNDSSSWKVVTDIEIKSYLESVPFLPEVPVEKGTVIISSADGQPFDVPLSLIKHAAGFESWKGREAATKSWDSEYGAGKMSSLDVIKHYAGLSTELPPVGEIRVFVQPDGKIYCDNGSGDSHRIAAALLRGDGSIKAKNLQFVRVEQNSI